MKELDKPKQNLPEPEQQKKDSKIRRRTREAKQEGKEEEEELTERAYLLKLLFQGNKEMSDDKLKVLELFDKSTNRFMKRLTSLHGEARQMIYTMNAVHATMAGILEGALKSNVDLVNKYGELKATQGPSKAQDIIEVTNFVLNIPAVAAMQQYAVMKLTENKGLPQAPEEKEEEGSD